MVWQRVQHETSFGGLILTGFPGNAEISACHCRETSKPRIPTHTRMPLERKIRHHSAFLSRFMASTTYFRFSSFSAWLSGFCRNNSIEHILLSSLGRHGFWNACSGDDFGYSVTPAQKERMFGFWEIRTDVLKPKKTGICSLVHWDMSLRTCVLKRHGFAGYVALHSRPTLWTMAQPHQVYGQYRNGWDSVRGRGRAGAGRKVPGT